MISFSLINNNYQDYLKKRKLFSDKLIEASNALIVKSDKYGRIMRLKEKVDFAAAEAVESKIAEINANATFYVDRMFDGHGTVINLSNFTTTKKGDERAKIGVNVFHKGVDGVGMKEFSGGEVTRACLAFQLGLSDLYSSPILMIDEGLTGLEDGLRDECMEVIRTASENKLVIVIEHGANESIFDEILEM
jgi:DNA repair exonuclease SbcCD ATPase subunit